MEHGEAVLAQHRAKARWNSHEPHKNWLFENPWMNGVHIILVFLIFFTFMAHLIFKTDAFDRSQEITPAEQAAIQAQVDSIYKIIVNLAEKETIPAESLGKESARYVYNNLIGRIGKMTKSQINYNRLMDYLFNEIDLNHELIIGSWRFQEPKRWSERYARDEQYYVGFTEEMIRLQNTPRGSSDELIFDKSFLVKAGKFLLKAYLFLFWYGLLILLVRRSVGVESIRGYFCFDKYDLALWIFSLIVFPYGIFHYYRDGVMYKTFRSRLEKYLVKYAYHGAPGVAYAYLLAIIVTIITLLPRPVYAMAFSMNTAIEMCKKSVKGDSAFYGNYIIFTDNSSSTSIVLVVEINNQPDIVLDSNAVISRAIREFWRWLEHKFNQVVMLKLYSVEPTLAKLRRIWRLFLYKPDRGIPMSERLIMCNRHNAPPFGFDFSEVNQIKTNKGENHETLYNYFLNNLQLRLCW